MPVPDDLLAIVASHRLGAMLTDDWPMAAAIAVANGAEGDALVELACLSANSSVWEIDPLVVRVLDEAGLEGLTLDGAIEVLASLLVTAYPDDDYPTIRRLARLAPSLDYDGTLVIEAYNLAEWLECSCSMSSKSDAEEFEARMRSLPRLNVNDRLASALTSACAPNAPGISHC